MQTLTTIALTAALLLAAPVTADTWHVDDDAGPGGDGTSPATAFNAIQAAIDASADGDTILVAAGDYGAVDLDGRAVHLLGADGAAVTTIAGGPAVRCVTGEGADTVIEGFTITGPGMGLHLVGASPTILFCTITGNANSVGAGARLENSSAAFTGCTFTDNLADVGGGMRIFGGAPTITECLFDGNDGSFGGGALFAGQAAMVEMVGCTITDHIPQSASQGAVIFAESSVGLMVNCLVARNGPSFVGGGVVAGLSGHVTMVNCAISRCVAGETAGGGGVTISASSSGLLVNCSVSGHAGGGILAEVGGGSSAALEIHNSILWGSDTYQVDGPAVLVDCDVQGGWSGAGSGIVDIDPKFVQPGTDDLRLGIASPCIDAGNIGLVALDEADIDGDGDTGELVPRDLAGNERVQGATVDLGALEGPFPPLPPAWSVGDLDPGEAEFLRPLGGPFDPTDEMATIVINTGSAVNASAVATLVAPDESAGGSYLPLGDRQRLETDLVDGTHRSTVFLPFSVADLGGASPFQVELARYDDSTGTWTLAALGQTVAPGTRIHVTGPGPFGTTSTVGDWGVWWNPVEQSGFAWVNADVPGTYAAALATCPADCAPLGGDGVVDVLDLVRVVLAWDQGTTSGCDLDGNGTVDVGDIVDVIGAWGTCD